MTGAMTGLDQLLEEGVAGKRVLVRSDLNVPLDGSVITDDGRIRASVPTIRRLADAGAVADACRRTRQRQMRSQAQPHW